MSVESINFNKHVRQRPAMYIGSVGSKGQINLLLKVISDLIDCNRSVQWAIDIELSSDTDICITFRGNISADVLNSRLSEDFLYAGIARALCSFLYVYDLENSYTYQRGEPCEAKANKAVIGSDATVLEMNLDEQIFLRGGIDYYAFMEGLVLYGVVNRNVEINVVDKRTKKINQNHFYFPEGLSYMYERIKKDKFGGIDFELKYEGESEGFVYQVLLGFSKEWTPVPSVISFANDELTIYGGSLFDGVLLGLVKGCKKYVKQNGLVKYKIAKRKFANGLMLVCSVRGPELSFSGSYKQTLDMPQIQKDVSAIIERIVFNELSTNKDVVSGFLSRFDETNFLNKMYM